ncbi:MAG: MFS transporter [Candidatus Roizmanbacteria bacterium]|nr:MFS transporter [Candidatus Roizmanbacteria bacterium]
MIGAPFLHEDTNRFDTFLFSILTALFSLATGAVLYLLPLYLLGLVGSAALVGLIIGGTYLWNIAVDLLLTKLGKKSRYSLIIKVSFLILLLFASVNTIHVDIRFVILSLLMLGTAQELFQFGTYQYIAQKGNDKTYSRLFSVFSFFSALGMSLGPIVSSFVLTIHYRFMFDIIGYIALICVGISLTWLDRQNQNQQLELVKPLARWSLVKEWHVWKHLLRGDVTLFFAFLLFGVFWGMVWFVGPLLSLDTLHLGAWAGVLMGAFSLPRMLPRSWFKTLHIISPPYQIALSFLCTGFSLLLFTIVTNPILILLCAFVAVAVLQIAYPTVATLLEEKAKQSQDQSQYEGGSLLFRNVGYILGSLIAGALVAQSYSLTYPFLVLSLLFFIAALLFVYHAKTTSIVEWLSRKI